MANSAGQDVNDALHFATATVTYTANEFRDGNSAFATPGRRDALSLVVAQHAGAANMSVDVSPGIAVVAGTHNGVGVDGIPVDGLYVARLKTTASVVVGAVTAARTDAVYIQVADKTVLGTGNDEALVKVLAGYTGSNLPESSLLLATLTLPANASQITTAMISNDVTYSSSSATKTAVAGLQTQVTANKTGNLFGLRLGTAMKMPNTTLWYPIQWDTPTPGEAAGALTLWTSANKARLGLVPGWYLLNCYVSCDLVSPTTNPLYPDSRLLLRFSRNDGRIFSEGSAPAAAQAAVPLTSLVQISNLGDWVQTEIRWTAPSNAPQASGGPSVTPYTVVNPTTVRILKVA